MVNVAVKASAQAVRLLTVSRPDGIRRILRPARRN